MTQFRYLTAGESHGKGLVGILEGLPSGIQLDFEEIERQMVRRKQGFGRGSRQQIETDEVEFLSGIRFGETLGSPISVLIWNKDWENWKEIMTPKPVSDPKSRTVFTPRPGHADLVGGIKYQHEDLRNVLERASARETAARVALGAVCRQFLSHLGVLVGSRVVQIGKVRDEEPFILQDPEPLQKVDLSPVRCTNSRVESQMIEAIQEAKTQGDTLGGEFEVVATGVPLGLGSYSQWDRRFEAEIGRLFLGLNAIKAVSLGDGARVGGLFGSEVHDTLEPGQSEGSIQYRSNRSGGIEGGMTTGQPLLVRAVMKPLSTLMKPLPSVHVKSGEARFAHVERSDVCAVPAAAVIGESLLCLALTQEILHKFGGDSLSEVHYRVLDWNRRCPVRSSYEFKSH